ncbi:N(G),N(G)-dimethylarginine dimethylaminohydrolase 1-like [Branchiostoma floridae]|uniref:N(G),N(G)-dimethylarginine dimethylaminohydrolase 1-like n=1 Tax=Branchiostoma floridae TaxID=7739 RepID=A0A9J7KSH6_BRAFL|nr:N(G),N(G)-dimethylarginine dimethylaminohydrolase 1-like [Branchiostoma floridae]
MSTAKFTRAIVRQIPHSIREHSESYEDREDIGLFKHELIDVEKARQEHAVYAQTLRELGLDVIVMPADESLPDCPFVEDICVIVGKRALLTRPLTENRRLEADAVEKVLVDLGLEVHKIDDDEAILEGGNLFFTGQEFFVGLSRCSNLRGAEILSSTFPEYPVHTIPLEPPECHLKGVACMAAPGVIAVAESKWGIPAWKAIREKAKFPYEPLWVPDAELYESTCDVIYFNGNLLHCTSGRKEETVKAGEPRWFCLGAILLPMVVSSTIQLHHTVELGNI